MLVNMIPWHWLRICLKDDYMKTDKARYVIIVESGATKSAWRLLDYEGNIVREFLRTGMNVSTMRMDDILKLITETFVYESLADCSGFYLYVAGVVTDAIRNSITEHVRSISRISSIDVQDDLTGAARAVFGNDPGIVAILGTGSNACFYDGVSVRRNVFSGGYILGDEGSAASLGKSFLSDFIKNMVPSAVAEEFCREFDGSYASIVEGVYRSESPSGYLGSLAPFIMRHIDNPYVKGLVHSNFESFVDRTLLQYDTAGYPVGIVGGFAYACRDIVESVFALKGIRISCVMKDPIEGLCAYHAR